MSRAAPLQTAAVKPLQAARANPFLQRKCTCGGASSLTEECEECSRKKIVGLQTKLRIDEPGDTHEQEADRVADQLLAHPNVGSTSPRISLFAGQNGEKRVAPVSIDRSRAGPGRSEPALSEDKGPCVGH